VIWKATRNSFRARVEPAPVTPTHMIRVTDPATTVLLGRKNYQGFGGFWPAVADNPEADERDRTFSAWLNRTERSCSARP
jgi:hypothetical protein